MIRTTLMTIKNNLRIRRKLWNFRRVERHARSLMRLGACIGKPAKLINKYSEHVAALHELNNRLEEMLSVELEHRPKFTDEHLLPQFEKVKATWKEARKMEYQTDD